MLKRITLGLIALFTVFSSHAGLVSNQDMHLEMLRGQVSEQLENPFLINALHEHGISQSDAEARIARLSQRELSQLSDQLENAPAGGEFVTWIIIGFAVVAITDALGYTDLFPFIKGPE